MAAVIIQIIGLLFINFGIGLLSIPAAVITSGVTILLIGLALERMTRNN